MRLIELEFAALGPFAGEHKIRFADFEASGLFLLRGATGSGKSSIIDAVLFALYGEAPLKDTSSALRLRSNFAAKDTVSYAQLLFEVPSGTYLVRRTPRYVKPGNKNATLATATLEKVRLVAGEIVERTAIGAKPAEVNPLIVEIIGIKHDQFLQTVVLPQGKFAEFVRATPDSRKSLLQQIFKTQKFDAFTEELKNRAKSAKAEFEALSMQARFHLSTMTGVEATDTPLEDIGSLAAATVADCSAAVLAKREVTFGLAASLAETTALCRQVQDALSLQAELSAVSAQRQLLADQLVKFERLREQTQAAISARPVANAVKQLHEAQTHAADILDTLYEQDCSFSLELADLSAGNVSQLLTACEKSIADCELRVRELEQQQHLLSEFAKQTQALADHDAQYRKYSDAAEAAETLIKSAQGPLENFVSGMQALEDSLQALPEVKSQVELLEKRLQAAQKADAKRAELVQCAEAIGVSRRAEVTAQEDYERAWAAWTADSARVLAQELAPGEACAVCGSLEHPNPAAELVATDVVIPTATEVAEKLQVLQEARLQVELKQQLQTRLTNEITELNQEARADSLSLELELEGLQADLAALLGKQTQLAALQQMYAEATAQLQTAEQEMLTNQRLAEENQKQRESLATAVDELSASVSELEGAESLPQQLAVASDQLAGYKSELNYLHQLAALTNLLDSAVTAVATSLADSPFSSVDEAYVAAQAVADTEAAAIKVSTYFTQVQRVEESFASLREQVSDLGVLPQLTGLERTQVNLQRKWQQAYAAEVAVAKQLQQLEETAAQLAKLLATIEQQEHTGGHLRRLADLAGGARTEAGVGIPLSTWVLMERFEAVLAAANPFIAKFSGSRFKLQRVDEDGNSSAHHGGLGLAVYDCESDQARPSKTLSGGETFYISLALALGLAEVVSAEAGGIDFKSMLIDEGFGTLDPETLDKVLEGIRAINDSGRTVGIVSHVEELRRRISDGIEVKSHPQGGSTLRVYS